MLLNVLFASFALLVSTSCNTASTNNKTTVVQKDSEQTVNQTIKETATETSATVLSDLDVPTATATEAAIMKGNEKKITNATAAAQGNTTSAEKTKTMTPASNAPITNTAAPAAETTSGNIAPMANNTISHDGFDKLLKQYVASNGMVDYKGLKANRAALDEYTALLAKAIPAGNWSKNESLAYWINAYNAFTLQLIINNYPLKSITNLDGGKPWDVKRITLAGKKYSLNNIENDIIRPQFKDPRIHFAVNCAAISCPPLANKAFTEDNIEALLNSRTISFMNSSANTITENKATISKLFDWYKEDFGNATNFINKYSKTKLAAKASIAYKNYDWTLNAK